MNRLVIMSMLYFDKDWWSSQLYFKVVFYKRVVQVAGCSSSCMLSGFKAKQFRAGGSETFLAVAHCGVTAC